MSFAVLLFQTLIALTILLCPLPGLFIALWLLITFRCVRAQWLVGLQLLNVAICSAIRFL